MSWKKEREIVMDTEARMRKLTNKDMNKKEVIKMAEKYSSKRHIQDGYLAGFQAACNIIRQKYQTCYNEDFCDAMEELAQVSYMDLDIDD